MVYKNSFKTRKPSFCFSYDAPQTRQGRLTMGRAPDRQGGLTMGREGRVAGCQLQPITCCAYLPATGYHLLLLCYSLPAGCLPGKQAVTAALLANFGARL